MPRETASNFVYALHVSEDGSLWFGTNGGGVLRQCDGDWIVFDAASGALPSDYVRCIAAGD
jgi:hypothetical protein